MRSEISRRKANRYILVSWLIAALVAGIAAINFSSFGITIFPVIYIIQHTIPVFLSFFLTAPILVVFYWLHGRHFHWVHRNYWKMALVSACLVAGILAIGTFAFPFIRYTEISLLADVNGGVSHKTEYPRLFDLRRFVFPTLFSIPFTFFAAGIFSILCIREKRKSQKQNDVSDSQKKQKLKERRFIISRDRGNFYLFCSWAIAVTCFLAIPVLASDHHDRFDGGAILAIFVFALLFSGPVFFIIMTIYNLFFRQIQRNLGVSVIAFAIVAAGLFGLMGIVFYIYGMELAQRTIIDFPAARETVLSIDVYLRRALAPILIFLPFTSLAALIFYLLCKFAGGRKNLLSKV